MSEPVIMHARDALAHPHAALVLALRTLVAEMRAREVDGDTAARMYWAERLAALRHEHES